MSKNSYQILDLAALTLIATAAEAVDVFVFHAFNSLVYSLTVAAVLGMIAIYRWNYWGLFIAPVAGAAGCLTRVVLGMSVTPGTWLAYTVGYLGLAICPVWFLFKGKDNLNKDWLFKLGYYFSGYLAIELLRAACQIGSAEFWSAATSYFLFDLFNVGLGLLIWIVACVQKGLVVDMNDYLLHKVDAPSSALAREEIKNQYQLEEMTTSNNALNDAALLDGGTLSTEQLRQMDMRLRKEQKSGPTEFEKQQKQLNEYQEREQHGKREN